jgi:hypothetical protein
VLLPLTFYLKKSMSSRFIILALCVGAIALACGPRAHNEASAPRKDKASIVQAGTERATPAAAPAPRAATTAKSSKPAVSAQFYVRAADSTIRLALHVVNTTKKRVELTFPSGQTYDFVILDSLGREMWRWGNGRMFTQALRNKLLNGGEALDLEETWKASSLAPGRYTARAMLTSENYPLVRDTEFTVIATTIASR